MRETIVMSSEDRVNRRFLRKTGKRESAPILMTNALSPDGRFSYQRETKTAKVIPLSSAKRFSPVVTRLSNFHQSESAERGANVRNRERIKMRKIVTTDAETCTVLHSIFR